MSNEEAKQRLVSFIRGHWEALLYVPSVLMWLTVANLLPEAPLKAVPLLLGMVLLCLIVAFPVNLVRMVRKPNVLRVLAMLYFAVSAFASVFGMVWSRPD